MLGLSCLNKTLKAQPDIQGASEGPVACGQRTLCELHQVGNVSS